MAPLLTARVFWLFLLKIFNCSFLSFSKRTFFVVVNPRVIQLERCSGRSFQGSKIFSFNLQIKHHSNVIKTRGGKKLVTCRLETASQKSISRAPPLRAFCRTQMIHLAPDGSPVQCTSFSLISRARRVQTPLGDKPTRASRYER